MSEYADEAAVEESATVTEGTDASTSGLLGAAALMAIGTVLSRVTGLFRDIFIVAAIGLGVFADTYSIANTVPNMIYILLAGGALNAVFIPQIVRHMRNDSDGGNDYTQRLLTLTALILLVISAVAVALAPAIVKLLGSRNWSPDDFETATLFARFCLPQIFFYGLFALFSQVLNVRGRFAAPMFAPIANNVVVIVTAIIFISVVTGTPTTQSVTHGQITLLAVGTTLGIAVQALILIPLMIRAGFRWIPKFGFRGYGLREAGYLAGWTFFFVATNQVAYIVVTRLATSANALAASVGGTDAGITSYQKAFLLFSLPHGVITVSLITALMPRMSRMAADGDLKAVAASVGGTTRLACAAVAPIAVALFVLGPQISLGLFGYGQAGEAGARFIGVILQGFVVGLIPFTIFYVLLRGYYSLANTKTPAMVNLAASIINVVAAVALYAVVSDYWKVPAIAFAFALSYLLVVPFFWRMLSRRLGGLPTYDVVRMLVRTTIAAALVGVVMWGASQLVDAILGEGRVTALIAVAVALAVGSPIYLWIARRMRIQDVTEIVSTLKGRIGRTA